MSTDAADNSGSNTTGSGGCSPGAGSHTPHASVSERAAAAMSQARRVLPLGPGWAARLALVALLSRPEGGA